MVSIFRLLHTNIMTIPLKIRLDENLYALLEERAKLFEMKPIPFIRLLLERELKESTVLDHYNQLIEILEKP